MVKRGKAPPVDNRSGWALSHEVLVTDEVWDATLNQTDVGNNANKYVFGPFPAHTANERGSSKVLRPAASPPSGQRQSGDVVYVLGPRWGERPEPEEGGLAAVRSAEWRLVLTRPCIRAHGRPRLRSLSSRSNSRQRPRWTGKGASGWSRRRVRETISWASREALC